jgi:uncharacterized protein
MDGEDAWIAWVRAQPLENIEYRRKIDAERIDLIAGIHPRHLAKPEEANARVAHRMGAAAVALGFPCEERVIETIASVRKAAPDARIVLSGFTNHENAGRLLALADGAFVGACFERCGRGGANEKDRVEAYMEIVRRVES